MDPFWYWLLGIATCFGIRVVMYYERRQACYLRLDEQYCDHECGKSKANPDDDDPADHWKHN